LIEPGLDVKICAQPTGCAKKAVENVGRKYVVKNRIGKRTFAYFAYLGLLSSDFCIIIHLLPEPKPQTPIPKPTMKDPKSPKKNLATLGVLLALLLIVAVPTSTNAQFTFATDNAGNSPYSDGWAAGDNGGTGFNAWTFNQGGSSGTYLADPASKSITGMSNPSWALFGNAGGFIDANRSFSSALQIGDTFTLVWGINFDTGAGNKGFNLYVGGTQVANVNNGNSSAITVNGNNTGFGYGTAAMTWTAFYSNATTLVLSANDRDGSGTFTTNIAISGALNNFRFYIAGNNNGGNAEPLYNNLRITNSGVYYATQTEARHLTGSGSLIVSNSSTLTITNTTNNYSGGTTVQSGSTLRIGADGSASGSLPGNVTNNGRVWFNQNANISYSGAMSGSGDLLKMSTGTLTLSAGNTFSGPVFIDQGTVNLSGTSATLSASKIDLGSALAANQVLTAEVRLGGTSGGRTFSSGMIVMTNSGAATRTLVSENTSGVNTWSGNITNTASANGGFVVDAASGGRVEFSGVLSDAGALTKQGSGTLTLSGSSANTMSGMTTINGGTLNLSKASGNAIAGAVTVNTGATLLLSASDQVATGAVTLSGGTIAKGSGAISETFGALTLSAANSALDFGSGTGSFTFSSYNPASFVLRFDNFNLGNSLTFSSGTFNASQFNFNGFGYSLTTGTGFTITAIPEPSTVVAALGLAGLLAWPARRRLLRDAKSILGLRAPARDRLADRS
jgi:fibronectin-binding autotransporter adhesin